MGLIPLDLSFCDKSDISCKLHNVTYSGHLNLTENHVYGLLASEYPPENSGIEEQMNSVDL